GAIGGHSVDQFLAYHVLHAEIERQRHGLSTDGVLRRRHGELRIVVDELLDACETLVVDIDVADDVTGGGADRIDAAIFLDEAETGLAKLVDLGLLLRRELALDGDEPLPLLQFLAELSGVDIR